LPSPEAAKLWGEFREQRRNAAPFNLANERELAGNAGEVLPHPVGIHYHRSHRAGLEMLVARHEQSDGTGPLLIWVHGGAFTLMSAHTHRHFAGHAAVEHQTEALIPDYSLAPEHPFPTALDELTAFYIATAASSPERHLILVGDSAGGALALALAMRLRDEGLSQPVLLALLCPWLDLSLTNASLKHNADLDVVLDAKTLHRHAAAYLAGISDTHELASPTHGNLAGLGPIYIQAAEYDVLVDDSIIFARRAQEAGVAVTLEIAAELPHCYQFFAGVIPEADAAMTGLAQRIRSAISSKVIGSRTA